MARSPRNAWIVVGLLTAVGAGLRIIVAHQPVFADELSTYWIVVHHGLGDVLRLLYSVGRIQHAEISPPLSFLASWVTTRLGHSPELLRLPALLAGTASIPLVFLLGARTVGRRAGLLAAALTTLSPFMIYYSAEARAYGLMMCFVVSAILCLLCALDSGRRVFWVAFAVLSAAAFLTHYTAAFVLAAAVLWGLWFEPAARRSLLISVLGAGLLIVPWIPGLIEDMRSPTLRILSALSPFNGGAVRIDFEHWAIGYPYSSVGGLRALPGTIALLLLALAAALVLASLIGARRRLPEQRALVRRLSARRASPRERRIALVVLLLVATPGAELLLSAFGRHLIGVRDMAASWPFLALTIAAVIAALSRPVAVIAAGLVVVAFGLGAAKMLDARFARPDYRGAAAIVTAMARPGDVVLDETPTPGPLTGFDASYGGSLPVLRARWPAERDHPFTFTDPIVPIATGIDRAVRAAGGHRVFVVTPDFRGSTAQADLLGAPFPPPYRLLHQRRFPGIEPTLVLVYGPGSR